MPGLPRAPPGTSTIGGQAVEHDLASELERREFQFENLREGAQVSALIPVSQHVAEIADLAPWNARMLAGQLGWRMLRSFGDDREIALDGAL